MTKYPTPQKKRKQRGWTELGALITFLVVLIMTGTIYLVYQRISRMIAVNSNTQQIVTMASTAKATYGRTNQYGLVTTAVAVQGHVIPPELRDGSATTASNSFGGSITVAPASSGTGAANDLLSVTWPNVASEACNDIVIGVSGAMRRISVNGTDVQTLDSALNPVLASTQCEAAANVTVTFYIGRS